MRMRVQSLVSLVGQGSDFSRYWSVGHRHGSDARLLCLWCRPAVVAPIPLLAWELPYATGVALKTHTHTNTHTHVCTHTKVSLSDLVDTHTHTEVPLSHPKKSAIFLKY